MQQFDVYSNPSRATRGAYPYIVDIQSPLIFEIATRIVIPLGKLQHFKNQEMKGLTPKVEYGGEELLLLIPQIASIPGRSLTNPMGSLSHLREEIIAALDFAITGV